MSGNVSVHTQPNEGKQKEAISDDSILKGECKCNICRDSRLSCDSTFLPFKGFLSVRNYAVCVGRVQCRPKIKQTE